MKSASPAPRAGVAAAAPPVKLVLAVTAAAAAAARAWCDIHSATCADDAAPTYPLVIAVLLSGLGCAGTLAFIPAMEGLLVSARLYGIDLNKPTTKRNPKTGELVRPVEGVKVPEPAGVISGTVYLILMFVFIPFVFMHLDTTNLYKLTEFITGLLTITCMLFLVLVPPIPLLDH